MSKKLSLSYNSKVTSETLLSVQWLAKKKTGDLINYLINLVFELQKSCHPHDHLAQNSVRLEASKKVLVVYVP